METTKYKRLSRERVGIPAQLPIKIVQYGEGNFLRAFVDYLVNKMNAEANFNAGVAVIQPLAGGMINILDEQDWQYSHLKF